MPLSPGTRLGPYEIVSILGRGGMGEVYRARDHRLSRDVAVKVLPPAYRADAEWLARFTEEARTTGSLNHPNILAIHDLGSDGEVSYLVSELLDGATLRALLGEGPLPLRKAIDYAIQIATGLAAAHEQGVIHRDLKPENLFVTRDGRLKILDFGLAKVKRSLPPDATPDSDPATSLQTEPGTVIGTAGYMAPEQLRGAIADARTDIFGFGAVLYEMLAGTRAFAGESAIATMNAVLHQEPLELVPLVADHLPPALVRIVLRCLEKDPGHRFQSARDLAFQLELLGETASALRAPRVPGSLVASPPARRGRWVGPALAAALLVGVMAGFAARAHLAAGFAPPPSYRQLTFRRGTLSSARFAPDGQTIVYSAAWEGDGYQLYTSRPDSPEWRPLGYPGADLLAVSGTGELAISLRRRAVTDFIQSGTLARVPLAGGAPREILENVEWADWSPDGTNLAVVHSVAGHDRLEYPIGKLLYETAGWISHPRISPRGDAVAFLDHPLVPDDGGVVALVDKEGRRQSLTPAWPSIQGLAWSSTGDEVWFTAARGTSALSLYAVTPDGRQRVLARAPGPVVLRDISRDGRLLVGQDFWQTGILGRAPGDLRERDLSWFDWSVLTDLSPDGKKLLLMEEGIAVASRYVVYLRGTDGSPAVRLGEGRSDGLSPDGKWALVHLANASQLQLLPTGAGAPRVLDGGPVDYGYSCAFPDGTRLLFNGLRKDLPDETRLYVQPLSGGAPSPLGPPGVRIHDPSNPISPDGARVAAMDGDGHAVLFATDGGDRQAIHPLPGAEPGEYPIRWSEDGRFLYVFTSGRLPTIVSRLEVATGKKERWQELSPADPAGIQGIHRLALTPDGKSYAYNYRRFLSDLFLVEGLSENGAAPAR